MYLLPGCAFITGTKSAVSLRTQRRIRARGRVNNRRRADCRDTLQITRCEGMKECNKQTCQERIRTSRISSCCVNPASRMVTPQLIIHNLGPFVTSTDRNGPSVKNRLYVTRPSPGDSIPANSVRVPNEDTHGLADSPMHISPLPGPKYVFS